MPDPLIAQIADAVTAELNRGVWAEAFAAVRRIRPRFTLEELATLRVAVIAGTWESELEDRDTTADEFTVDVCLQKKLTDINDAGEVDPLLLLAEQIHDRFRTTPELADCPATYWIRTTFLSPVIHPQHADELNLFTSVISLTFATGR